MLIPPQTGVGGGILDDSGRLPLGLRPLAVGGLDVAPLVFHQALVLAVRPYGLLGFRAVENRVPFARAANTGVSAIVDGNGRVLDRIEKNKEGVLSGVIPLDDRSGAYSLWGDWLGQSCLACTLGLLVLGTFAPRVRAGSPSA